MYLAEERVPNVSCRPHLHLSLKPQKSLVPCFFNRKSAELRHQVIVDIPQGHFLQVDPPEYNSLSFCHPFFHSCVDDVQLPGDIFKFATQVFIFLVHLLLHLLHVPGRKHQSDPFRDLADAAGLDFVGACVDRD